MIIQSSGNNSTSFAMSAATNQNHLLIVEDNQARKNFPLEKSVYSIGRDKDCTIRLFSQFVSRHHATLIRLPRPNHIHQYYYRIVDGDAKGKSSANGLMINGRKINAHNLNNEDEIIFGPQVRAVYYLLKNTDIPPQIDVSEYDITLISPNMNEDVQSE